MFNLFVFMQLDIVFHFNKVYSILDEYILAGEVQGNFSATSLYQHLNILSLIFLFLIETNKLFILNRMKDLEKLD